MASQQQDQQHLEIPITGMSCASCANRVERSLNDVDGVVASVNYATERATVDFDPDAVTPEDLVGAVVFFLSDDAAFITGQTLPVNGGACIVGI